LPRGSQPFLIPRATWTPVGARSHDLPGGRSFLGLGAHGRGSRVLARWRQDRAQRIIIELQGAAHPVSPSSTSQLGPPPLAAHFHVSPEGDGPNGASA